MSAKTTSCASTTNTAASRPEPGAFRAQHSPSTSLYGCRSARARVGAPGWRDIDKHLPWTRTDTLRDLPPTAPTSMRNLAAPESDRRLSRKLTLVGVHPDCLTLHRRRLVMQTVRDLGADVDSRTFVVACAARSVAPQRVANERRAILAWLRTVPPGSRLGLEATGAHHELLADLAHRAGLQVFVLN